MEEAIVSNSDHIRLKQTTTPGSLQNPRVVSLIWFSVSLKMGDGRELQGMEGSSQQLAIWES
jgi:hypothetical protein